jgi:hypothetical protein
MANSGKRHQLRGMEMFTDPRSLSEARGGGAKITLKPKAEGGGVTQISPFNAVQVGIIKQPLPPVDPPAARGQLALVQKHEGRPEGATSRPPNVADPQALPMRAPPDIDGLLIPAEKIGDRSQPLQILKLEPGLSIRRR